MLLLYESLKNRAIHLRATTQSKEKELAHLNQRYTDLQTELSKLTSTLDLQEQSITLLKTIISQMSLEQIKSVENLLTQALQTIFHDRDYKVIITVDEKRSKNTAEFYLQEVYNNQTTLSSFRNGIGGGILAVVGFVLQVYYIQHYQLNPILFMDESLSQLSDEYIPTLLEFIKQLSLNSNFRFVLISHDERFISKANKVYAVDRGTVKQINHKELTNEYLD